jgi:hypothetical protein
MQRDVRHSPAQILQTCKADLIKAKKGGKLSPII